MFISKTYLGFGVNLHWKMGLIAVHIFQFQNFICRINQRNMLADPSVTKHHKKSSYLIITKYLTTSDVAAGYFIYIAFTFLWKVIQTNIFSTIHYVLPMLILIVLFCGKDLTYFDIMNWQKLWSKKSSIQSHDHI